MDPLSITASVIAVATAAVQISQAISRLRAFGEVPGRVYALKNEVTDLEVVLRQVGLALQQKTLVPESEGGSLNKLIQRTKESLTGLAKALERVANACEGGKTKLVSKSAVWWKEKALFKRFQEDLHAIKLSLNVMLGASNSYVSSLTFICETFNRVIAEVDCDVRRDLHHIILELRRVTVLTSNPAQTQDGYSKAITEGFNNYHLALSSRLDQQYQALNDRLEALGHSILSGKLDNEKAPFDDPGLVNGGSVSSDIETLRVLIAPRTPCRNWCPCACHGSKKTRPIPGVMENLLGKMFFGYTGLPVLNKPCDFRACRDQQTPSATMEYWFPWWFVSMNMKMYFQYLPNSGPQLQLSTTRRVPDSSQSITFAMKGDIDGLKYLFTEGLASPRDVSDSRGYTLMRWALYGGMHQYQTVKFLIDQGARVDENSYENVWDFLFRGKCNREEAQALRCITEGGDGDWVEEQNFPLVHRIIFGLSSKSLAVELQENPLAVYITDAQGRTALDWATARIQLEDMACLLRHGADPNNMDITGRTAVLHAVDSHNVSCLRLILEAGGNPNPTMPKGVFRSSPPTACGFAGIPEMLKLLLDFGAQPNACNPEGLTALHSVARTQNIDCAAILLNFGANLNAASNNGLTPWTTAIIHNNHQVLQLFVERFFHHIASKRLEGPPSLPIIAEHADKTTMSILSSNHLSKLSHHLNLDDIAGYKRTLHQRRDYSVELAEAFEELISIIVAEEAEARSVDSLMEAGLFFSARSSFHSDIAGALSNLESATVSSSDLSGDESDNFEDSQETLV